MSMQVKSGRHSIDVRWTLIDRLVEWINPAKGVERLRSRLTMSVSTGGYTGGRRDRRATRNWRPEQKSANEDISPDLPDLRSRSRDLVRNVPIATGAIATVVTSVIGDGLVVQSQIDRAVLGLTEDAADAWQRQAEREFAIWARNPDFTTRLNWDEMQELAMRAVLESGDVFIVRRRRKDPQDTYNLKLQVIEADRISNQGHRQNTASLVDGIEMDADGRPIKYWISSRHPDDTGQGAKREWQGYEAGSSTTGQPLILHLYKQLRPDQARGIPYLSPVVEAIKTLGDYAEAEVRAAVIAAMFTVFVKMPAVTEDDVNPIVGSATSTDNVDVAKEIKLENGAVHYLADGEEVSIPDTKRPNTGFDAFVTAMSRHIGVALELPYELLLKSFTASYSASRAALEMAWQMFRTKRSWLAWKFCQPVYEWVITEAVASGRLAAPGFFTDPIVREAWLGSDWIGPSRIQLDPQKEASADLLDLNMGTKTRAQIIMERTGGSFEAKHAQLVKEQNLRDGDGLTTAATASEAMQPPQQKRDDEKEAAHRHGELMAVLSREAPAPVINVDARTEVHTPDVKVDVAPAQINVETPKVDVKIEAPNIEMHAHLPKKGSSVRRATAFDDNGNVTEMTEIETDG